MKRKFTAVPGKGIFATSRRRIAAAEEYDGKQFGDWQMEEINKGLEEGLDVSQYADPKFNWRQMNEIREGLKSGVDVSVYADPKFDGDQMGQIRNGLEAGVDVSQYADPKFDGDQMDEICKGLKSEVDVNVYADPKFHWSQMEQIRLGLEAGVDVSQYADPKLDRMQMERIREGLKSGVDVSQYAEPSVDTDHESNGWIDEDDFYNMDPEEFWETYLSGAEWELSDELDIYIEPSIQLGAGSIYIHDESDDDNESIGVDYQEWIEHEQALAGEADSAAEFKDMMRTYIKGLMEDAGWDR